jgi:hypothetical protein
LPLLSWPDFTTPLAGMAESLAKLARTRPRDASENLPKGLMPPPLEAERPHKAKDLSHV